MGKFERIESGTKHYKLNSNDELKILVLQIGITAETNLTIDLLGENAKVEVLAISFANRDNKIDNFVKVNHMAKNCESNLIYKTVLNGNSNAKWVGDVLIDKDATGTKTYEENRNIILNLGPTAISEPNLEILTGDIISAGHASATGRFEEEQLFYLLSRGIDEEEAKRLVVNGFFNSILEQAGLEQDEIEQIEEQVNGLIGEKWTS